jgi:alpha-glucoside transport system permease protein
MSGASVTAEPPAREAPPRIGPRRAAWRRYAVAAAFLGPAVVSLGVWIVYPTVNTMIRSFFDRDGESWVGIDNYKTIFTTDLLVTAVKNNALWVAVVPMLVTAIGLVLAVLTERVRWAVAFKTALFMPMAISLLAAGVIWRLMYVQNPDQGTLNAGMAAAKELVRPAGELHDAFGSSPAITGNPDEGLTLRTPLSPGDVARLGLAGIPPTQVPDGAAEAATPEPLRGGIAGVVWLDFKPGGGTPGRVERRELGLPGVPVELLDGDGEKVGSATSADDGTFAFEGVEPGDYRVKVSASAFAEPFAGVSWLGEDLITPSVMIAYIWVWAGFAMVVIAAGLAAIPRDLLEAARTDGGSEWQVFRRVTVPLLAPVLSVVFITMLINVLKIFDIVISVAPGSTQDDANVIALAMWRTSFGGANDFGLGSAIAVFLFLLVLPVLALNIRRFRREV